jgi:hypothetical protein
VALKVEVDRLPKPSENGLAIFFDFYFASAYLKVGSYITQKISHIFVSFVGLYLHLEGTVFPLHRPMDKLWLQADHV